MRKKQVLFIVSCYWICITFFTSCNSATDKKSIATDSASISLGQTIFNQKCAGCHNFRLDGIGPNLSGVTTTTPVDWIRQFIKDPKKMIESGDYRAGKLYKKYHAIMPSFGSFTDKEIDGIIAFIHTHKMTGGTTKTDSLALKDPIPQPIVPSNLVMGLQLVTQIPHSSEKLPFTRIAKLGFQPDSESLFILDQRGILYKLDHNKPVVYLDIAKSKPKFINEPGLATGFGSFAFHPDFAKNGLLYTSHTEAPGSKEADFKYNDSIKVTLQWVISEWKTDHPGVIPFSGKSRELFRVNMVTGIHGVQEITFNPLAKPGNEDYGQLYIGVGDGGSVENGFPFLAHHLDKIWGTIIRIDPLGRNSANGNYGISQKNPFFKNTDPKILKEIYAYGFRNPNRITWSKTGQMLASNIGQANIESLNLILKGHDYGWPIREGTFALNPQGDINKVFPLPANDTSYHINYPVAQYDHDEGNAISGGFDYWGSAIPQLMGKYLFGDIAQGRLFYVNIADLKTGKQAPIYEWNVVFSGRKTTLHELTGNDRVDLRFGRDQNGDIYILTKPDGKVYRLIKPNK